ncbi:MAG: hypothetical protein Q7O66_02220, partial [Dehalococcoidia bacterium]|nr:hypothetical protein [Dehalococcoidia bacterium]
VEGYVFEDGVQERWVLWSVDGNVKVTLPAGVTAVQNNLGQSTAQMNAASSNGRITLGESPLYLSLR